MNAKLKVVYLEIVRCFHYRLLFLTMKICPRLTEALGGVNGGDSDQQVGGQMGLGGSGPGGGHVDVSSLMDPDKLDKEMGDFEDELTGAASGQKGDADDAIDSVRFLSKSLLAYLTSGY